MRHHIHAPDVVFGRAVGAQACRGPALHGEYAVHCRFMRTVLPTNRVDRGVAQRFDQAACYSAPCADWFRMGRRTPNVSSSPPRSFRRSSADIPRKLRHPWRSCSSACVGNVYVNSSSWWPDDWIYLSPYLIAAGPYQCNLVRWRYY